MGLFCCTDSEPQNENSNQKQIVIAGSFYSGKSTFFKHLTILLGNRYSTNDFEKDLQNVSGHFLIELYWMLCDLEEGQFDDLKQLFKTEFEIIKHEQDDRPLSVFIRESLFQKDCKQLLLKFWNENRFEQFYELILMKQEEFPIISDNLPQLVKLIKLGKKDYNPNDWVRRSRHHLQSYCTYNYKFIDVGACELKRSWRLYIFPKTVLYLTSLAEFNIYEDYGTSRMRGSILDMEETLARSERKARGCKKIIIFTKPDLLLWKLRRGIKYERELNYKIRPELEKIENQHVKLIVNSIVNEFLIKSAIFNIHSYHIINASSDSDILHVCDSIFRGDNNKNRTFISPCLLPISSQLPSLYKYYQLGLLTDISIGTYID